MSFAKNVFMSGDSHSVDLAISAQIEDFQPGGYGLFSMFDKDTLRPPTEDFKIGIGRFFSRFNENSTVLLSYLDTECRTGIGERTGKEFHEHYEDVVVKTFDFLRKSFKYKKMIFVDMYGILNETVGEMTCSPAKRLSNRRFLNSLILKHGKKYDIFLYSLADDPLFVDEGGFVLGGRTTIPDGVHYNLSVILANQIQIKDEIISRLKGICDETILL